MRGKTNGNSIRFNISVSPDQPGDNFIGFIIITHDRKIECLVIVSDLEGSALGFGLCFIWVALAKAFVEGSTFPYLVVQNAIQSRWGTRNAHSGCGPVCCCVFGFS